MNEPEAGPPPGWFTPAWQRVRPLLVRVARGGKRRVERLLHPHRRRAARSRLMRLRHAEHVVVLCYGNICRSPYAAAVLERILAERGHTGRVSQGGFFGPDRPANQRALAVARDRGVDLTGHRSRLVTPEEARGADLVIVMEQLHAERVVRQFGSPPGRVLVLGDLDPGSIDTRSILDPYGLDLQFFSKTYERIDRCLAELARSLDRRQPWGHSAR